MEGGNKRAIRNSQYFLALLSSNSVARRGYVHREMVEALEVLDESPDADTFVIPVRLNDCQPAHEKLSELHQVDMFPSWEEGMNKILHVISAPQIPLERTLYIESGEELLIVLEKYKEDIQHIDFYFSLKNVSSQELVVYELGLQEVKADGFTSLHAHAMETRVRLAVSLSNIRSSTKTVQIFDEYCHHFEWEGLRSFSDTDTTLLEAPIYNKDRLLFVSAFDEDAVLKLSPKRHFQYLS